MTPLRYEALEKIRIKKPVDRIDYILGKAKDRRVLDLGSYDETALFKTGTRDYLFGEIAKVAASSIGIDNSEKMEKDEVKINEKSRIIKRDIRDLGKQPFVHADIELIVAGELIEHLPDTFSFFCEIRKLFSGKEFICSTPNALSLSNILLGLFKRESTHQDHLQIYSYKTLNTLCLKCGFSEWEILPYHVRYTEMIHQASGIKKNTIRSIEKIINFCENIFPSLSGGLILHVRKI